MINLLKKHKYKLLTLMLSIVSIFTLFLGINKTYAYESNQFTYTFNNLTYKGNEIQLTTINGVQGYIVPTDTNSYRLTYDTYIIENNSYYFMINYYYLDQNTNTFANTGAYNFINPTMVIENYNRGLGYLPTQSLFHDNTNMYTNITRINYNGHTQSMYFSDIPALDQNYQSLFIVNMDFVAPQDIGLSYYYDTYYGQIEDNYNQLLSDYDTLEDNYGTLQTNYNNTLQSYNNLAVSYNDLQTNYGTLQSNYNELDNNYDTLQNNYNDLENDYEDLQTNYDTIRDNSISSIIKNGLNGTSAKLFAFNDRYAPDDNLSFYINNNGVYQETITYSNSTNPYYSLSSNNPNIYSIIYNSGSDTTYIDKYCGVFYSFSIPVSLDSLIFERGDTTGTRYINIWFSDSSMTQLTIDEGSDNRHYVLFNNSENKLITNILCTAEKGYNAIDSISVPNSTAVYSSGFDSGYSQGYSEGLDNGYNNGIKANNIESYNRGYNDGANTNLETNGMRTLFNSILSYPVNMIKSVFDFEFMGINISSLIMFIISIGIVAFVIKKFL